MYVIVSTCNYTYQKSMYKMCIMPKMRTFQICSTTKTAPVNILNKYIKYKNIHQNSALKRYQQPETKNDHN